MKHYKIFGQSLKDGVLKIGATDVFVEIVGILIHAMALSPYAGDIKDVLSHLTDMGLNTTSLPFPDFGPDSDNANATTLCNFSNGSHFAFNVCIGEISLGSAGVLIHTLELLLVVMVLKMGKEKNIDKCNLWVKLTAILSCLDVLVLIGTCFLNRDKKVISYIVANLIYKFYSCGLVKAYTTAAKDQQLLPGLQEEPVPGPSRIFSTNPSNQNTNNNNNNNNQSREKISS